MQSSTKSISLQSSRISDRDNAMNEYHHAQYHQNTPSLKHGDILKSSVDGRYSEIIMRTRGDLITIKVNRGSTTNMFLYVMAAFEGVVLILYGIFANYADDATAILDSAKYPYFQDIHVMMFVGFGFLMTFLQKFGYSAVGFTMLATIIAIQWNPLLEAFWASIFTLRYTPVQFSIATLIRADFCATALLISFGAWIGKISPTQLVILSMIEPILYNLNVKIAQVMHISDIGGSMVIHAFGASFGLAASKFLSSAQAKASPNNTASYNSNLIAMLGTIFLWMYWPSFNAAMAFQESFNRAVVNTVMALTGSGICAFMCSFAMRGNRRFCMVDIQNAALAGDVAIGSCADLPIGPGWSMVIGCIAGIISTGGYVFLQERLSSICGVHDTCGIASLHGMPAIIAGFSSSIATAFLKADKFTPAGLIRTFPLIASDKLTFIGQAGNQILFLIISIAIGVFSGSISGIAVRRIAPCNECYQDSVSWEIPREH